MMDPQNPSPQCGLGGWASAPLQASMRFLLSQVSSTVGAKCSEHAHVGRHMISRLPQVRKVDSNPDSNGFSPEPQTASALLWERAHFWLHGIF